MARHSWLLASAITMALGISAVTAAPASAPVGVDQTGIDRSIQPGDDFNGYANGNWEKTAVIPSYRSSTGIFLQLYERAEKRTADLVKAAGDSHPAKGSQERLIADYYAAFMNVDGIEKAGLKPLDGELSAVDAIKTRTDLSRVLGSQLRADVDPINATNLHTEHLFGLFVAQGLEDPSHNMPYLLQGGLGMPNRDYYLGTDKNMVEARQKYQAYIADVLKQSGTADADAKARDILALEMKIASAQQSIVDSEDIHKANNPWPTSAFASKAPGIDWNAYFKAAGLDTQKTFIVWQPATVTKLSALVASEPVETWKTYLRFHVINENAWLLPKAYVDMAFEFFGHTLQGTPKQSDRWKRGLARTNIDLGDAVGQIYVKKYFSASSRAQVQTMVENILKAFDERVDKIDWMTAATKKKASEKIGTVKVGVGYPDTWRDYSSLDIRPDDAVGNHLRAQALEYRHQVAKLSQPVDRNEWWMTPQTVNAVNLPLQNALNFPAAILEAPFFDPKADAASNYGSIGAVIGHEISHSFDNTGAEFDAQGRLANWWTDADQQHFKAAGQRLVEQYNQYEALPGLHVNGQQTLGENIADVSGLAIAYAAYRKSLNGKEAPVIDGLTGDQRFFLAFAQSWRTKSRDAALRAQIIGDGHAPGQFRAQTVRNIDAWYDAFSPKPGQKLYLDPSQRVKIW
ncbi:putative endopeptidase [Luteibacter sp. Sphag1AF]|uniref:M13 family metallopeptidase n=1 Tax=Luteibacter sp. Sphag1AF TaxID=2587031 RepID=UPI001621DC17|nr:M13 family metallopeptidase [Luteibacter sp. Sphag1AF]MBB3227692.1 putative endopeptidase [Luteibacter sp. Sphag1AF]